MFYDWVCQAINLPNYVDKRQALTTLVSRWAVKYPLIAEAMAGRASFEKTVEPIVSENLKIRYLRYGACASESFRGKAGEIAEKVKDVFYLRGIAEHRVFPYVEYFTILAVPLSIMLGLLLLSLKMQVFRPEIELWLVKQLLFWGTVVIFCFWLLLCLTSEYGITRGRQEAAKIITCQARFLDEIFAKLRSGGSFN
ncbi:MAG: hypothetical protein HYT39_01385 [Candidatus Sungbacteria bacterium]|nr:hypothetical protein [Candidatus Sungbacteria bacterium]